LERKQAILERKAGNSETYVFILCRDSLKI